MTVETRTIATPFGKIAAWESSGRDYPVLMLHGTAMSRKVFGKQFAHPMADRLRLIAIDLPGHGDSPNATSASTYTVSGLAAVAGAVLEALEIDRAAVFGWSLGGHVAVELMSYHPAVAGVMLTGAPPLSKGPLGMLRAFHLSREMLLASKEMFSPRDVERFGRLCLGEELMADYLPDIQRADGRCRIQVLGGMTRGDGADQRRTVETATVPVALVNGEDDRIVRLSALAGINSPYLWGGRPEVIAHAGHAPFLQQPEAFNELFFRFVAEVAASPMREEAAERQLRSA